MKNKELSEDKYRKFGQFLEQTCGIVLGDSKQYLVRSRLSSLLYHFNIESMDILVNRVTEARDRPLMQAVIDAMTTNETLWFRDGYPYSLLASEILEKFAHAPQKLRIWSAACSSGQEPYSIAMTILEYQKHKPGSFRHGVEVLGTDLSSAMLEKCEQGIYDELSLARGLSTERRQQFFTPCGDGLMQINQNVKALVKFRAINLLHPLSGLGRFDIVFCRNVLIYFAPALKQSILQQIAAVLPPDGILFLGASESIHGATEYFKMVKAHPGLYYQRTRQ